MHTYQLRRLGNPILRYKSKPVPVGKLLSESYQSFLESLVRTCVKHEGVGIAAPQVGRLERVIVVHVDPRNPRYSNKEPFPLTIIVNPKVTNRSRILKEDWEGDLSVDLRGLVTRSVHCTVVGLDRTGQEVTYVLENDFHARVFQHEIDHLDGILFLDKVLKKNSFSEYKEWKKYWKDKNREDLLGL